MSTLREVAQQALRALEKIADWDGAYGPFPERNEEWRAMAVVTARESVTALRAALAQEEQPNRAQQMRDAGYARRPTLREMGEQEREPVAWGVDWGRDGDQSCCTIIKRHADGTQEVVAVEYGSPRREWKGLSDTEVLSIHQSLCNTVGSDYRTVARAIEQALRSKNHE